MPQKEAPKFLMILGETIGGRDEQPRQFLSLQEDDLNPLWILFNLRLLLTSASDREALSLVLPLPLPLFLGVTGSSGALG